MSTGYTEIQKNNGIYVSKEDWMQFISSSYTSVPHIPENILNDWKRAIHLSVSPTTKSIAHVLSREELTSKRQKNSRMLEISKPILEIINNFISQDGFVTAISDCEGIILDIRGDLELANRLQEGGWVPGADWSEGSIGNNVIGTCIHYKRPLMLYNYEHFCRCCHNYAGASAPIFHNDELIGVIAICGTAREIHRHTLGMLIGAMQAISNQLKLTELLHNKTLDSKYRATILNFTKDGIIGVDAKGIIIFCNTPAYRLLGVQEKDIIGKSLFSMLGNEAKKWLANPFLQNEERELIFNIGKGFVKCICSYQSVDDSKNKSGFVMVLRNTNAAIKTTKQFVELKPKWSFNLIIGKNPQFLKQLRLAEFAAKSDCSILISGESGTGKEVLANSIHNASSRKDKPFVAINCGAIPQNLIESELFGYKDGAFTGAKKGGSQGKFAAANGGTLFLDEIGEMPLEQQRIFLRVLEEDAFYPIGSTTPVPLNVRIIAATNRNFLSEINNKRFRLDLYYRLNVFGIETIPLRKRKDDIVLLADFFLKRLAQKNCQDYQPISAEVIRKLCSYDYPGNIRELQNILEKAYILSGNGIITPDTICFSSNMPEEELTLQAPFVESKPLYTLTDDSYPEAEDDYSDRKSHHHQLDVNLLSEALQRNYWNISKTCKQLGVSRTTIYRLIKKYDIIIPR